MAQQSSALNIFIVTIVTSVFTVNVANVKCKAGFENIGHWCFSFYLENKSLSDSIEICKKAGGNMVLMDEYRKIEMLRKHMKEKGLIHKLTVKNREALIKSYQEIREVSTYQENYCNTYKTNKLLKPAEEFYIPNAKLPINFNGNGRARLTTPSGFFIAKSSISSAGYGAWTKTKVRKYTVLGEYEGEEHKIEGNSPYSWVIYEDKKKEKRHFIDASSPAKSNWLRYINCARNVWEENVYSFVCDNLVFYMTTKEVEPNTELLTWYGRNDGLMLGITKLHPASELDLNATFYIRLSYMLHDFKKNDLKYHQNWFSNKHDIQDNKIQYGVLDSYHDGAWKIQRENNYTYYTGEDGFSVPFVCEHQPLDVK